MGLIREWLARRSPAALDPAVQPRPDLVALATSVKGFLAVEEGLALFQLAREASVFGACAEIGAYCGKSSLFIGEGCKTTGGHPLFSIDHHHGSEEQQPGQEYFDPDVYDRDRGRFTTLETFAHNIDRAGLTDWIVPVVGRSVLIGRYIPPRSLGMVFIDGAHGESDVNSDYETWAPRVTRGGYLCFHDLFADPAAGGQAPYRTAERARASREWQWCGQVNTLGILRRR